jgi:CRP-like cAMP-binding protein
MTLPSGNRIIDACRATDASLLENASVVTLEKDQWTTLRDKPMKTVDFPVSALLSVIGALQDGSTGEVASVGTEGFVEIDAALRNDIAMRSSLCLFAGQAIRVPIADFQRALREDEYFSDHVYHAVRSRVFVSEQLVVCAVRHNTGQRLARWLLLASERTQLGELSQTHEQLASALGVRRASISVEASELQSLGAISYRRGLVKIEDRPLLNERACECYALCHAALTETLPVGSRTP